MKPLDELSSYARLLVRCKDLLGIERPGTETAIRSCVKKGRPEEALTHWVAGIQSGAVSRPIGEFLDLAPGALPLPAMVKRCARLAGSWSKQGAELGAPALLGLCQVALCLRAPTGRGSALTAVAAGAQMGTNPMTDLVEACLGRFKVGAREISAGRAELIEAFMVISEEIFAVARLKREECRDPGDRLAEELAFAFTRQRPAPQSIPARAVEEMLSRPSAALILSETWIDGFRELKATRERALLSEQVPQGVDSSGQSSRARLRSL